MKNQHNLYLIILITIILSRFWGINSDEIQPWDEGIYASRIKACVEHDLWFDQTDYSPKGLYSSAHPPLVIWSNAVFVEIFENEPFSYRIGTVIFGIGIILLLYFMNENKSRAMISVLIFSLSSFLLFYTQHTQLDIPLAFFILLGLFAWNKYKGNHKRYFLILTGIAFGFGMWTKIIIAIIIPVSIFLDILFSHFKNRNNLLQQLKPLGLILIIGTLMIAPWFIIMGMKYGSEFLNYYFVYHIFSRSIGGVEGNTKALGVFFYINQIVVMLPIGIAFLLMFYKSLIIKKANQVFLISLILQFIVFSFASTKLATYIIPVLVIMSYLAGNSFKEVSLKSKLTYVQALILIVFQSWSFFPHFRRTFTDFDFLNNVEFYLVVLIMIVLYFIFTKIKFKNALFVIFAIQLASFLYSKNHPAEFEGIEAASNYYYKNNFEKIYHIRPVYNSEINNPQITFYFNWIDLKESNNYKIFHDFRNVDSLNDKSIVIIEKGIEINNVAFYRNLSPLIKNSYYKIYITNDK